MSMYKRLDLLTRQRWIIRNLEADIAWMMRRVEWSEETLTWRNDDIWRDSHPLRRQLVIEQGIEAAIEEGTYDSPAL